MARENVCWKHTTVKAAARCPQCSKPICSECVVESDGQSFCSDACISRNQEFKSRNPQGVPKKSGFATLIMRLVGLVILLAIGLVVAAKVLKLPFAIDLLHKVGM